jgi:hypothetical protein
LQQIKTYQLVPDAQAITNDKERFFNLSFNAILAFFYEETIAMDSSNSYKIRLLNSNNVYEKLDATDDHSRWTVFAHIFNMKHAALNPKQNKYDKQGWELI